MDIEKKKEEESKGELNDDEPNYRGIKAMPFVIGNETFEKLGTIGTSSNLLVYLTTVFNMKSITATNLLNIFNGTCNFGTLLGAFLCDTYLGRYKTLGIASVSSFLGMLVLTLTAAISKLHPHDCNSSSGNCNSHNASPWQLAFLLYGFAFLVVGASGIRPCNLAFGADQFNPRTESGRRGINSFFNWYYFTFTFAMMVSLTVIVYVQSSVSWAIGLGIPAFLMFLSCVFFFIGTRIYVKVVPEGSPLTSLLQVIVAAIRKRKLAMPQQPWSELFNHLPAKTLNSKLPYTDQFRYLNRAAIVTPDDEVKPDGSASDSWRLCSVQQVEEVKCVVRVFPIWVSGIVYYIVLAQMNTYVVFQALQMDRALGGAAANFKVPAASYTVFAMMSLTVWIPVYDRVLVPFLRACTTNVAMLPASPDTSYSSNNNPENQNQLPSEQVVNERSCQSSSNVVEKNPIGRIEQLQIKFLRVLHRLGLPLDNIMVSKVLYRIHLATMIRARESDLKRCNLKIEKAREIAAEQEAFGQPELDVSFKVLLLGKTGVGKSSMINSIFDQNKAMTNAFHPATKHVQEITGTVKGVKIAFIDTPGLLPSSPSTARRNRKILRSVKRYARKNPPDLVLYFERLDLINVGYSDFPLLRLVTEVFGPAIWFNTVLVMTHSSSALPEGPHGYPVTFESYTTHCTDLVQHYIHQAVSDTKLKNPVILVENHPHCKANDAGEKLLPNGQAWRFQFLLTCLCTKVLGDVNTLLDFGNRIKLGPSNVSRLPSLPHLLSSFLKHRAQLTDNGTEDAVDDEVFFLESDEEDEYDQLPPIRVLTKAQYEKLSPQQKNDYLDELDYRETLYLKKQMKEEAQRRREALSTPNGDSDGQQERVEPVLLPDMDIPPSFSSDYPVHRYRCLTTSDQWVARPVLDPHGWDHEVSFDGINLETTAKVMRNVFASVTGQMSKDKQDFSIQSKCTAAYSDPSDPRSSVYTAGLDIQSARQELICSVHSNAQARTLKHNITECGVSLTSFGANYFLGTKVEDSFTIGKRLKFTVTGGQMAGARQAAVGGSFGATLRGRDYPVRNESVSFTMTLLSFNKETVLSGNLQSDFRLSRGTNVSVNANLNSQKMGQVSIKTSSCEHMEIAFIAVFSILRGLLRRKVKDHGSTGTLETGSTL